MNQDLFRPRHRDVNQGDVALHCDHLRPYHVHEGEGHWFDVKTTQDGEIWVTFDNEDARVRVSWVVCCDSCGDKFDQIDGECEISMPPIRVRKGFDFYLPN